MRLIKHPRIGPLLISAGSWVLRGILWISVRTLRLEIVSGEQHLRHLYEQPRPVVVCFWHNRAFLAARFVLRDLFRQNIEITVLASQSRDGELVAKTAKFWRFHTVRGSATRGGRQALRALYRTIIERGSSPVMIPDGPQGPIYNFKIGVAVLAQMTQAPILPLGLAAENFWRIKSWDRLIIPRPFTRIALAVGPLQTVARGLTTEELEETRLGLQTLLDDLTHQAEEVLGVSDHARP